MDWDQAVTVKNDEDWKEKIIDQYHEHTERLVSACPTAIVVDYIGKIENQLMDRYSSGQHSQLLHRLQAGVEPMMNHPVWIGFDAATGSSYPDGSVWAHTCLAIADLKRKQGQDVLVEALPAIKDSQWGMSPEWTHSQHALCLERFYQHRVKTRPNDFRFTSDAASTFRVANGHSRAAWDLMKQNGVDPLDNWVESCFNNGHTPIFAMPGYSYADFAERWRKLAGVV